LEICYISWQENNSVSVMINKDTKIYGSFSANRGNTGTKIFNTCFAYYDLNAIYRSFSIDNIEEAVNSARCLGFSGFAVSMPYKNTIINYLDSISEDARTIGAVNTVINDNGHLYGYNTDWRAAKAFLTKNLPEKLVVLGNGGYAAAVRYAAKKLNIQHDTIDRASWARLYTLRGETVFNCTPVENIEDILDNTNNFIDCVTVTASGKALAMLQAAIQFKLYTGLTFPLRVDDE